MRLSSIRNSDEDHSCLTLSLHWLKRRATCSITGCFEETEWLTCFPSRGQTHNLLFTDTGLSLGEVKPALWAQEEELCFLVRAECTLQNSPALLNPPHLGSAVLWGHRWRSHSTPRLSHLIFNHTVKEFSPQGPSDPWCPLHPQSPPTATPGSHP